MMIESPAPKPQQLYVKVPHVTGLYRHAINGGYHGAKKIAGKRREVSLKTTDRKIAERKLRDWVAGLAFVDREVERTTLRDLLRKSVQINQGKAASTQATNRAITKHLEKTWPGGTGIEVRQIRPSHLDEWLALHEKRLKNTSYNRYAGFLKQLFDIALKDRIIAASPFAGVKTGWKSPQTPIRKVPTVQQFNAIVDCIRSQPFTDHAKDSSNFVEFLGLAGLGQAEASSLTWGDVDWTQMRLNIRRHKTDTRFYVPIYEHLRPLMEKLKQEAGAVCPSAKVFKIKDAKKALATACRTLGYHAFSQRNMRQCLIGRLWKAGVDYKMISKWQGHRDGGQLIINTYTQVFGAADAEYETQQLAKLVR